MDWPPPMRGESLSAITFFARFFRVRFLSAPLDRPPFCRPDGSSPFLHIRDKRNLNLTNVAAILNSLESSCRSGLRLQNASSLISLETNVNHQNEEPNEPKIVGFESQPIPENGALEVKKYGLIAVAIAFLLFIVFVPSRPSVGNPSKNQEKYVAPESKTPSYRSAKEATEAVQNYVDQQMKKNQEMFDSINRR